MAKKIKQYRYYKEGSEKNFPAEISGANLISGTIFNSATPITQLGIQTVPGTTFYVNNSVDPIVVGSTGIYELDLSTGAFITNLRFNRTSIENIASPNNMAAYLIVDTVYEIEED